MALQTRLQHRAAHSDPRARFARSASPWSSASWPGSDALLLMAATLLPLSLFELAIWLASVPLTTLVCCVACVLLALLFTAALWDTDATVPWNARQTPSTTERKP